MWVRFGKRGKVSIIVFPGPVERIRFDKKWQVIFFGGRGEEKEERQVLKKTCREGRKTEIAFVKFDGFKKNGRKYR